MEKMENRKNKLVTSPKNLDVDGGDKYRYVDIIYRRYLLVHPTNRGCGLVHPGFFSALAPTYPISNQAYNPLTRVVG